MKRYRKIITCAITIFYYFVLVETVEKVSVLSLDTCYMLNVICYMFVFPFTPPTFIIIIIIFPLYPTLTFFFLTDEMRLLRRVPLRPKFPTSR